MAGRHVAHFYYVRSGRVLGFFLAASVATVSFTFMVIVLFGFSISLISGGVLQLN